jgi:hypothetical protein
MIAFATKDGHIFWGENEYDIVCQMRRSDFLEEFNSNRIYMTKVAARLRNKFDGGEARGLHGVSERDFLHKLVELGFLDEVTQQYECPMVHCFCSSRQPSCEGDNAYCWIKKQETDVIWEDEVNEEEND